METAKPLRKSLSKKPKSKNTLLFDFLKDITLEKQNILDYENNYAYSKYMICRFLSMNEQYLPMVDSILNKQQANLSNEEFHKLCLAIIPKKNVFLQYIKGSSKITENKEDLIYIANYFNISMNDALEYYEIAGEELVKKIKFLYGIVES